VIGQRLGISDFGSHEKILLREMGQGLLAECQAGRPFTQMGASNDGTIVRER
jgi:hypothetical protein